MIRDAPIAFKSAVYLYNFNIRHIYILFDYSNNSAVPVFYIVSPLGNQGAPISMINTNIIRHTHKNTMSDRKKIIIAIICLIIYVVMAIFFWSITKWVTLWLIISEYIAQVCRHKTLKIPAIVWAIRQVKGLKRVIYPLPLVLEKEAHIVPANVVDSIADILAYNFFINCVGKGDYSAIGTGTQEQLQTAFNELLGQYYEVRGDERMKVEIKLRSAIAIFEARQNMIALNVSILKSRYSPAAANGMRKLFTNPFGVPLYSFSLKTLENDIRMALVGEKNAQNGEIANERNKKQLAAMYGADGKTAKQTLLQRAKAFTSTVLAINNGLNSRHGIHAITLMEYAIGEQQLEQHMNNLKDQADARRR